MRTKSLATVLLLFITIGSALAQRVKRKGVTPMDVTKNRQADAAQKNGFSTEQLLGKWQEVSRTDRSGAGVPFTDTLYLNFMSPQRVMTRQGMAANMTGDAAIDGPNTLLAAADVYSILSITDSILTLDNQEDFIHTLKKTGGFIFENYGKNPVKTELFTDPVPVTLPEVMGRWMVYKKDAKPGVINPPVNIIQYLKITDSTGENMADGEVTFYQTDKSFTLPCSIKVTSAGLDITAGGYNWFLFVYKADKKEMVFGDAAVLLYFSKSY